MVTINGPRRWEHKHWITFDRGSVKGIETIQEYQTDPGLVADADKTKAVRLVFTGMLRIDPKEAGLTKKSVHPRDFIVMFFDNARKEQRLEAAEKMKMIREECDKSGIRTVLRSR